MKAIEDLVHGQNLRQRSKTLFQEAQTHIHMRTDRMFGTLMAFQWVAGIVAALVISPRTWVGTQSLIHIHVWAAVFLGGIISFFPILLVLVRPGKMFTRYVIAVAQMLMSALLIHLTGGRIETHFHVFGSLAFLAFYRDWRVLIPATVVVAVDHLLRGIYFPQSVFGVLAPEPWRWLEHAGWVIFEDCFLIYSCRQSIKEMWAIATRTAELEAINQTIEATVVKRTQELTAANEALKKEITGRKLMEESLWESQEKLRHITNAIPGMVHQYRLSREGKHDFLFVSHGAYDLFEISDDILRTDFNLLWNQILPEDQKMLQTVIQLSAKKAGPLVQDFRIKTPAGKNKWIRWISVPESVKNGDLPVRNGIFLDITDHMKLQSQLVEFEKSETVARLAAGAAHEVKNPLAILLQGLDYLSGHTPDENQEIPSLLHDMEHAVRRADTIIKGLLNLARPTQLVLKSEDLNEILEGALLLVKNSLDRAHIHVEKSFGLFLPSVNLDKDKMTQVFINLFGNAIDAMPSGGTLTVKSYTRKAQGFKNEEDPAPKSNLFAGRQVVVEIEDTGPGIAKEVLPKLFEPFVTTKRGRGGTGLGLPIVRNIVQFHRGQIEIKNREEGGARATLSFAVESKAEPEKINGPEENIIRGR